MPNLSDYDPESEYQSLKAKGYDMSPMAFVTLLFLRKLSQQLDVLIEQGQKGNPK